MSAHTRTLGTAFGWEAVTGSSALGRFFAGRESLSSDSSTLLCRLLRAAAGAGFASAGAEGSLPSSSSSGLISPAHVTSERQADQSKSVPQRSWHLWTGCAQGLWAQNMPGLQPVMCLSLIDRLKVRWSVVWQICGSLCCWCLAQAHDHSCTHRTKQLGSGSLSSPFMCGFAAFGRTGSDGVASGCDPATTVPKPEVEGGVPPAALAEFLVWTARQDVPLLRCALTSMGLPV